MSPYNIETIEVLNATSLIKEIAMDQYAVLDFPEGKIAFEGTVRVDDRGATEFRIELPGRPQLYGEWRSLFLENQRDFNVEVISFGYIDKYNVGNLHPGAKYIFSVDEKNKIEILISELAKYLNKLKKSSLFSFKNSNYLGNVIFRENWITTKS